MTVVRTGGRRRRWVGWLSLLGVVALVGLTACSGDDDDAAPASSAGAPAPTAGGTTATRGPTTTTRPPLAVPTVGLTITNEGTFGAPEGVTGLGPEVHDAVMKTLNAYVQQASVAPLATGQPAQGLDKLFSASAIQRLSDATRQDRSTVTDEGLAPATTKLSIDEAKVGLIGLADEEGTVGSVAAKLSLKLSVVSDSGAYTISRQGDLTLLTFAGGWFIDGWNLQVAAAPDLLTNSPTPTSAPAVAAASAPSAPTASSASSAPPAAPSAPPAPVGSGS